jgi:transposase
MNQTTAQSNSTEHWVGLDVSKQTFDAAVMRCGQRVGITPLSVLPARSFARTPEGVDAFVGWLEDLFKDAENESGVRCVMEATGRYSTELSVWLVERRATLAPAIEPPRQTAAFMESLGIRTMTDQVAARALAAYGMERQPEAYQAASPEELELREVCRYRHSLVEQRTALLNQADECSLGRFVARNQAKRIALLDGDIKRAEAEMRRLVKECKELQGDIALLDSVYGVGFVTAVTVRVELGDLRRFTRARQLNAFAGLNPSFHHSGTSVRGRARMCKQGNARARHALYMSAITIIRGDNDLQRTYTRLIQNGKTKMAAIGAVMRKTLCVMRAILISGKPYDRNWKSGGKLAHVQA